MSDKRNVQRVRLDDIKPDPNQPRKHFDDEYIAGLAESIADTGLINPIEIDSNYVIITGECRYRACKLLQMEHVDVSINEKEYSQYERFRRQIIENIQQSGVKKNGSGMGPIDTAKAFNRLFQLAGIEIGPRELPSRARKDVTAVLDGMGITRSQYDVMSAILKLPPHLEELAIKNNVGGRAVQNLHLINTHRPELLGTAIEIVNQGRAISGRLEKLNDLSNKLESKGAIAVVAGEKDQNYENFINSSLKLHSSLSKIEVNKLSPARKRLLMDRVHDLLNLLSDKV